MIVAALFILVMLCNIFALKDIWSRNIKNSMKICWTIVVFAFPIVGISIYYFSKLCY